MSYEYRLCKPCSGGYGQPAEHDECEGRGCWCECQKPLTANERMRLRELLAREDGR